MIKVVTFMRAADPARASVFQQEILTECRAALVRDVPDLAGLIVNLVLERPDGVPYRPASDPTLGTEDGRRAYDVIAQTWSGSATAVANSWVALAGGRVDHLHGYAVTETVVFDKRTVTPGRPSAGIKLIGRLMFHPDMPDSAVKRSWALHAGLATRVHVGAARYVQNWVEAPLSAACPPARGMPEMHFPTLVDLTDRFFDSPRGGEEILQDTAHFVRNGPRFYTCEYVMLAPPQHQ